MKPGPFVFEVRRGKTYSREIRIRSGGIVFTDYDDIKLQVRENRVTNYNSDTSAPLLELKIGQGVEVISDKVLKIELSRNQTIDLAYDEAWHEIELWKTIGEEDVVLPFLEGPAIVIGDI